MGYEEHEVERGEAVTHGYTHQKRPYRARCIQFDGGNFEAIKGLIPNSELGHYPLYLSGFGACEQRKPCILVRHPGGISTLYTGYWAVQGENGAVKVYSDEVFRTKYQEV